MRSVPVGKSALWLRERAILGLIWDAPGLPSQSVPLPSHFLTTRKVSVLLSNSQIFLQNVVFSAVTRIFLPLLTVYYFRLDSSQHHGLKKEITDNQ